MTKRRWVLMLLVVVGVLWPARRGVAQSASLVSVQLSATALVDTGRVIMGGEGQFRLTFGRLSLGAGYQAFAAEGSAVSIVFLEPRFVVVGGEHATLYVAGRAGGVLNGSDIGETVLGGGGGVLIRLGRASAMDLGAQYYTDAQLKHPILQTRAGFSLGF